MKNGQSQELDSAGGSIVQCPKCLSYSAEIVSWNPVRARCAGCGTAYRVHPVKRDIVNHREDVGADEGEEDLLTASGTSKSVSGAPMKPATAPEVGLNTILLEQAIAAGPGGIRNAQRIALKFAKKYHEEAIDYFKKVTPFLQDWIDKGDSYYRARARFALVWRPRFLSALSMTNSVTLAAHRARISRQAIYEHRKADAEFAKQWDEAVEHAIDLLHARAFQGAL
jgi:hypothetical protein